MLSIGNLASNALTLVKLWGFRPDDVLLHALPVFHVHGLFVALHCAFLSAIPTIFLPQLDAQQLRILLPRATVLMGVPTFYTRLLALPDFCAANLASATDECHFTSPGRTVGFSSTPTAAVATGTVGAPAAAAELQ